MTEKEPFDRLTLLLEDYKSARQAAQAPFSPLAAIITAAIASGLSVLAANWDFQQSSSLKEITPWLALLSPLALLLPATFAHTLAAETVVQSFYSRALEQEIRLELNRRSQHENTSLEPDEALLCTYPDLRLFTSQQLKAATNGASAIRSFGTLPLAVFVVAFTIGYTSLVRRCYLTLVHISDIFAILTTLTYAAIAILIARRFFLTSYRGRQFFEQTLATSNTKADLPLTPERFSCDRFAGSMRHLVTPNQNSQTVGFLPKPDDAPKIVATIAGATVAATILIPRVGHRIHDSNALLLIVGIIIFELVIYQGRYIINDIIGIPEELTLNSRDVRRRLTNKDGEILASVRSLAVRATLTTVTFSYIALTGRGWTLPTAFTALTALTTLYEVVRKRQAKTHKSRVQILWSSAQYILVSLGLPLRFMTGFMLYAELELGSLSRATEFTTSQFHLVSACTLWTIGYSLCSVTTTWALEGLAEALHSERGHIIFHWKAEGKRHVWHSTRIFLRCIGIRAQDKGHVTHLQNRDRELSGRDCWSSIAEKDLSRTRRIARWIFTPWTLGTALSFWATILATPSLLGATPQPIWTFTSSFLYVALYTLTLDYLLTSNMQTTYRTLRWLTPMLPTLILSLFHDLSLTQSAIVFALLFSGGPFWTFALKGTYSDLRRLLPLTVLRIMNADKIIACKIRKSIPHPPSK